MSVGETTATGDAGIAIRLAEDGDSAALCRLIETVFGEYDGVLFVPGEMPELLRPESAFAEAGGALWTAWRGERLVGSVGFTLAKEAGGIELKKLYVAREARVAGLGGQLVALVEEAARERGASFVDLWSDVKFVTAHRFYARRGYERGPHTRRLYDLSDTVEYYFKKALFNQAL